MDNYDVVMKLIGEVDPIGSTHVDNERFDNLQELIMLTDRLLTKIDDIAYKNKDAVEFSRKKASQYCSDFYTKIGIKE